MSILKYCASYVCFIFMHCAYCVRLIGDVKAANNILKGVDGLSRHQLCMCDVHSREFTHIF